MSDATDKLVACLQDRFGRAISIDVAFSEVTAEIAANDVLATCTALRDETDFAFTQLSDLCAVDYLTFGQAEWETTGATGSGFSRGVDEREVAPSTGGNQRRFAVVYHLLSITHNVRLRLKVYLNEDEPIVDSVVPIWTGADWFEREAFDLYGVMLTGS